MDKSKKFDIIFGVVTYNRIGYLKGLVESWAKTKNPNLSYCLVFADDGSTDGTREYINGLEFENVEKHVILNSRRGVHHQVNQILKLASGKRFRLGIMSEDDLFFVKEGWDNLYLEANHLSGYDHLAHFSTEWSLKHRGRIERIPPIDIKAKKIQSKVTNVWSAFGVFWTFTDKVIRTVGYFDLKNMGLWNAGHTDYSVRCCRAGFNHSRYFYDAINSSDYIKMVEDDYRPSLSGDEINFSMYYNIPNHQHKGLIIERPGRIYVPYNELPYDMLGRPK